MACSDSHFAGGEFDLKLGLQPFLHNRPFSENVGPNCPHEKRPSRPQSLFFLLKTGVEQKKKSLRPQIHFREIIECVATKSRFISIQKSLVNIIGDSKIAPLKSRIAFQF